MMGLDLRDKNRTAAELDVDGKKSGMLMLTVVAV